MGAFTTRTQKAAEVDKGEDEEAYLEGIDLSVYISHFI